MEVPTTEAIKTAGGQKYPKDVEGFKKGAEWAIQYLKDKNPEEESSETTEENG